MELATIHSVWMDKLQPAVSQMNGVALLPMSTSLGSCYFVQANTIKRRSTVDQIYLQHLWSLSDCTDKNIFTEYNLGREVCNWFCGRLQWTMLVVRWKFTSWKTEILPTVKPFYNDHLMGYISAFWSSSRWPLVISMSSRRQKLLATVNWYLQS